MRLFKQQTPNCLLYSAAMVLDVEPEILIKEIGHDGQEIWWPEVENGKRGMHIQEIMDCFWHRGFGLVLIEKMPRSAPYGHDELARVVLDPNRIETRFLYHLYNRRAILISQSHACAWDGSQVYDPNGKVTYNIGGYGFIEAWIMTRLDSVVGNQIKIV